MQMEAAMERLDYSRLPLKSRSDLRYKSSSILFTCYDASAAKSTNTIFLSSSRSLIGHHVHRGDIGAPILSSCGGGPGGDDDDDTCDERSSCSSRRGRSGGYNDDQGEIRVGVPFTWESQPGTPKVKYHSYEDVLVDYHHNNHPNADHIIPPLAPPPSAYLHCTGNPSRRKFQKSVSTSLLRSIFPKLGSGKSPSSSSSTSAISSSCSSLSQPWASSSTHSMPASLVTPLNHNLGQVKEIPRASSRSRLSIDSRVNMQFEHIYDEVCEDNDHEYAVSVPCFGGLGCS